MEGADFRTDLPFCPEDALMEHWGFGMARQSGFGQIRLSSAVSLLLTGVCFIVLSACRSENQTETEQVAQDNVVDQEIKSDLTFRNVTLEQADEQGRPQWKVKADEVTYRQERAIAEVTHPKGELFQDGKAIYRIQGRRGEVRQDGERILLRGQIVATDLKSGAVFRGDRLEWIPETGILTVRNNLKADHPQIQIAATEAQLFSRDRRLEVTGGVDAVTKDPALRMQAERLTWLIDQQKVSSDRPVQVTRLFNNQPTDTAQGARAAVDLKTRIATLEQSAQLNLQDPPIQVSSDSLIWDLAQETLTSNQPVTVIHQQQQVTLTANQGRMDIRQRIFYLTQNVRAVGQQNQSQLTTDRLTWTIPTQEVLAEGNVNYSQLNPPLKVQGPRAVGKLENQTIVVSGGGVVTEIIPQ
jgi:LPS export ABC transporter protein LptC